MSCEVFFTEKYLYAVNASLQSIRTYSTLASQERRHTLICMLIYGPNCAEKSSSLGAYLQTMSRHKPPARSRGIHLATRATYSFLSKVKQFLSSVCFPHTIDLCSYQSMYARKCKPHLVGRRAVYLKERGPTSAELVLK